MQNKIIPHLAFNNEAEEAVSFYLSIFKGSRILNTTYYGKGEHGPEGSVRTITFELLGEKFWAVNGGPDFEFSEGLSLYVSCDSQEELDDMWNKLTEGGEIQECGWLRDKFGVPWQISATEIDEMVNDPDPEKSKRAVDAIMMMEKLDIEEIRKAFEGQESGLSHQDSRQ